MNAFRHLLLASGHQPPIGTWISSARPLIAEAMGDAGFDWGVAHIELAHAQVLQAMAQAARRARACGKPIGTLGATPEQAVQYRATGFDFVALGSDIGFLMRGAQAAVQALRTQDVGAVARVHTLQDG